MKTWLVFLAPVVVTLLVLAFGGLEILYHWRVTPILAADRETQAKFHPDFLEDLNFIDKSAVLPSRPPAPVADARDAGSFLNAKLFWSPTGVKPFGAKEPLVDQPMREWLVRIGTDWTSLAPKKRKIKPDLSFLAELASFEVWDIEKNSPIEDLQTTLTFVPPSKLPIPDPGDLIALVKLRLVVGSMTNEPMKALREVRKLAELLFTTENIELTVTGFAVLDHERRAYNYYLSRKQLAPGTWQVVDRNVTRRAHRALLASSSYLRLWTDPKILNSTFMDRTPAGFCGTVNEAYPLEFSLRKLLEPRWPLERDLSDEYASLDRIFQKARSACRLRYLTKLAEVGRFAEDLPGPVVLNRLPYVRKVFGMRLSTANFGGFDAYSGAQSAHSPASTAAQ